MCSDFQLLNSKLPIYKISQTPEPSRSARGPRADPTRAHKAAPRKIAALQTVILNERQSRE
jgi:hypothetical protein